MALDHVQQAIATYEHITPSSQVQDQKANYAVALMTRADALLQLRESRLKALKDLTNAIDLLAKQADDKDTLALVYLHRGELFFDSSKENVLRCRGVQLGSRSLFPRPAPTDSPCQLRRLAGCVPLFCSRAVEDSHQAFRLYKDLGDIAGQVRSSIQARECHQFCEDRQAVLAEIKVEIKLVESVPTKDGRPSQALLKLRHSKKNKTATPRYQLTGSHR